MIGDFRCAARLAAILCFTIICVAAHYLWCASGARSPWPRRFLGGAGWLAGFRVKVRGAPVARDVFFIANHISWADIFVLAGVTGCAFVARDDLGKWPVAGWLASLNNTILVARSSRAAAAAQVAAIRTAIDGEQPVALFPEGTTGDGRALLPFKPTLLAVLLPPPRAMAVQPVAIDYGEACTEIAWTGEEGGFANLRRVLGRRGATPVTLHFIEPVDPVIFDDRKALTGRIAAEIAARLAHLRAPPPAV